MELMFDLETLDTKPSAVVLSIGAVVWEAKYLPSEHKIKWYEVDKFLRVLDIQKQLDSGRTVSQATLLWWMDQDPKAKAEAFDRNREPVVESLDAFRYFAEQQETTAF